MSRIKDWTLEGTSSKKGGKTMCNVIDDYGEGELSAVWIEIERR